MNLLLVLLNLPIQIYQFLPFDSDAFTIVSYIYYISYAVNFYILFATNSLFRKNILFHKKSERIQKPLNQIQTTRPEEAEKTY